MWVRAILHVDMDAFFASVEQTDFPELKGQAVAVTNGKTGTCIITSSYEARHYGIKTGMRLREARKLCPRLVQRPSRPGRYAAVSSRIMATLEEITPDLEIFSVDEAFLDITRVQKLLGSPEQIACLVQKKIFQASGISCSVGASGDKTTAKYAAKLNKPAGISIIPPWQAEQALAEVPVEKLCGIARGIGAYLNRHGVYVCGDMKKIPISVLARRFGNPGRRIWLMAQGKDPDPVNGQVNDPKSIGHGKVVPPDTSDKTVLQTYFLHMSSKVAARLRRFDLEASKFFIGLRTYEGWIGERFELACYSCDVRDIYALCLQLLNEVWQGEGICQVQVTAINPAAAQMQVDLFDTRTLYNKRMESNRAMDRVNERYGEFSLCPARLLLRSEMPNVIAPAWKPFGHRQTIQDTNLEKSIEPQAD